MECFSRTVQGRMVQRGKCRVREDSERTRRVILGIIIRRREGNNQLMAGITI